MGRRTSPQGTPEARLAEILYRAMQSGGDFLRAAEFPAGATPEECAQVAAALALLEADDEATVTERLRDADKSTHGRVSVAFDEGVAACAATRRGRRPKRAPVIDPWQAKHHYVCGKLNLPSSEDTLRRTRRKVARP